MDFNVQGMSCGHCAASVTRAVEAAIQGAKVEVDLAAALVRVQGAAPGQRASIVQAIEDAGYDVVPAADA